MRDSDTWSNTFMMCLFLSLPASVRDTACTHCKPPWMLLTASNVVLDLSHGPLRSEPHKCTMGWMSLPFPFPDGKIEYGYKKKNWIGTKNTVEAVWRMNDRAEVYSIFFLYIHTFKYFLNIGTFSLSLPSLLCCVNKLPVSKPFTSYDFILMSLLWVCILLIRFLPPQIVQNF